MEILHVIDDYVILIGFGCLLIIYFSTKFFRKNDTSKVIKNEYHKFNCDYVYVEKEEIHRFRQKEFNTNQYFCISIDEDPKSSSHLISMNPHDVCILDIERMYFK